MDELTQAYNEISSKEKTCKQLLTCSEFLMKQYLDNYEKLKDVSHWCWEAEDMLKAKTI